MYEGIHKLCFTCGRVVHKVEAFPYTIRRGNDAGIPAEDEWNGVAGNSRDKHEDQQPNTNCNTTNGMEEVEREG